MEFIAIISKCGEDINADIKCEFCSKKEMVYGHDTDEWHAAVGNIRCASCKKSTESEAIKDV